MFDYKYILNSFKNKKVLITGHTGFKGTWLSAILKQFDCEILGVSLKPTNKNFHYLKINKDKQIKDIWHDITDYKFLNTIIKKFKPNYIFHLAAQSLVRFSYTDPINTWKTNLIGTQSILESLREYDSKCVGILITSDKCYYNKEWIWGYRENDELGGIDPYSASKASAELMFSSYFKSYFNQKNSPIRISTVRAGNVIGGGDWSEDRIVPDIVKSWINEDYISIRSPNATRPWQHVLEPLFGYLSLAAYLNKKNDISGESFNFGPNANQIKSVRNLVDDLARIMDMNKNKIKYKNQNNFKNHLKEAGLLKLNCDKALNYLNWKPLLNFEENIEFTAKWYIEFLRNDKIITFDQISKFISKLKVSSEFKK